MVRVTSRSPVLAGAQTSQNRRQRFLSPVIPPERDAQSRVPNQTLKPKIDYQRLLREFLCDQKVHNLDHAFITTRQ